MSPRLPTGQPSPELLRARELLADGRWHHYEPVLRELIKVVPPGRAIREADKLRLAQARKRARYTGQPIPERSPPRPPGTDLDRVRETGARAIIRKMIHSNDFDLEPPTRTGARRIRWTTPAKITSTKP